MQAQGSKRQITIVLETQYGVIPVTPQTIVVDYVDFTGNLNAPEIASQSIRSNRQHAGSRRGNTSVEGELKIELAPGVVAEMLIAAVMQGEWAGNTLKVGSDQRSFTFEEGFTDIGQYRCFVGCVFTTMSVEVGTDGYVIATFRFIGKTTTAFSSTSICATPTVPVAKERFFHEGGTFKEGGATVGYLANITFDCENSATVNNALGVSGVRSITSSKFLAKGKVTGLFESVDFYNKFVNDTASSIGYTLPSGIESLGFEFPTLKYTQGAIQSSDAGVTVEMDFTAEYDEGDATTLLVTKV